MSSWLEREALRRGELADEGRKMSADALIRELVEAGDGIACYPSGSVGFDDWWDAKEKAEAWLGALHLLGDDARDALTAPPSAPPSDAATTEARAPEAPE